MCYVINISHLGRLVSTFPILRGHEARDRRTVGL